MTVPAHAPAPRAAAAPCAPAASAPRRYADNILYAYAKPSSIVVTTIISCLVAGALPSLSLLSGVALVVSSIFLYSSKPKPKAE